MSRILGIAIMTVVFALGGWRSGLAFAQKAKDKKAAEKSSGAAAQKVNACGCYANGAGSCFCGRKAKCGCPGECEPKGCEEKRARQMEKEIAAETRKAAEAERKQRRAEASGDKAPKEKPKPKSTTTPDKPSP